MFIQSAARGEISAPIYLRGDRRQFFQESFLKTTRINAAMQKGTRQNSASAIGVCADIPYIRGW